MGSIFSKTNDVTQKPPRNAINMSFNNHLTLKAGLITPCYLQEVIPGDSAKIDASMGFSMMPIVFPVQSRMQCNLHFFYVRNRALWKGWENFITKTENLEGDSTPPFIQLTEENRKMFETGEIGDYLGIPTVQYGSKNQNFDTYIQQYFRSPNLGYVMRFDNVGVGSAIYSLAASTESSVTENYAHHLLAAITSGYANYAEEDRVSFDTIKAQTYTNSRIVDNGYVMRVMSAVLPSNIRKFSIPTGQQLASALGDTSVTPIVDGKIQSIQVLIDSTLWQRYITGDSSVTASDVVVSVYVVENQIGSDSYQSKIRKNATSDGSNNVLVTVPDTGNEVHEYVLYSFITGSLYEGELYTTANTVFEKEVIFDASVGIPNSTQPLEVLPFYTTDISANPVYNTDIANRIRVSAMPFRAVEACYNAFYRDDRNNPLMIDGKPYYNVWVQNRNGGADTGIYELYHKNWQQDVFTTAVQSPQQGIMPLVGVTATGQMTFADEEGKTYYLQAEFGDDGKTITGISSYSSDMPAGTLRAMVDTISTGISINDFRNVNALQRWLETNMRKGLRYKDQIEAHFGTSPTYSELQMPEFIGGMSRDVHMSAIEQTVDTLGQANGAALGTLGGRGSISGDGKTISHYCDEHGFIIGFISVTPAPVYSQTLNKMLTKTELFDYYFPEFAHIGYQPILNKELTPLQCAFGTAEDGTGLDDVFGYQRAWYDYLERYDEVHGDFRSNLRDYLVNRIFDGVPKLGKEFLTVSDKEVNEIFAVQDDSDKIFGQIHFDVVMKRPIPKFGIPKLEVG